jgi:polysaccharide biosynthesis protein PslH
MRILWLSHLIPYPPKAGVLLRAYYLLKAVAEQHEVDLFAFIQEPWLTTLFDSREQGLTESRRALEAICRRVEFAPIELLQRPLGKSRTALEALVSGDAYMLRWLQSKAAHSGIAQMAVAGGYDLVHLDIVCLAPFCTSLPSNMTIALNHHNIESHMLLRRADNESSRVKSWYFRTEGRRLERYEQRLAGEVALNVTCSDLDTERLRAIAPRAKCLTIPNGVDVEFFRPAGTATRPDSMIFVGTMNWYPNVSAVLFLLREIMPRIRAKRPNATLDIVGANAPPEVRQLAAETPGATLHGFVPEVRPLIDSAALYVCPIRDGGGTKLKVLDAFAMEKCLVADPIACEGIAVENEKDVVFASSPEEYEARVLELFDDEVRRRAIGKRARELVASNYSFESIGRRLADAYSALTHEAARRKT